MRIILINIIPHLIGRINAGLQVDENLGKKSGGRPGLQIKRRLRARKRTAKTTSTLGTMKDRPV
jgi:hypothetical protein